MSRVPAAPLVLLLVLQSACGDDGAVPASVQDVRADARPGELDASPPGYGQQDTGLDLDTGTSGIDAPAAGTSEWAPCPAVPDGSPGCPCGSNADCLSAFCVGTAEGKLCTDVCVEACPSGFSCSNVTNTGGDTTYICLPLHISLCRPCATGADCAGDLGGESMCLPAPGGAGSFCGGACDDEQPCPTGYACDEVDSGSGKPTRQCRPVGGECGCSAKAVQEEATTPCTIANEHGACEGTRSCSPLGLTECNAPDPSPETCNGGDDDCDGETDEGLEQACETSNALGACSGTRACVGGSYAPCGAPEPVSEACNGADDDCNGLVDDGFDDTDMDGEADCIDDDDDNDGVLDVLDNCKWTPNPDQTDADSDGLGDACDSDRDGDGAPDDEDNCLGLWNPGQEDCDGDGAGDACDDLDKDGDGAACTTDNCPEVANPGQEDCDGDGLGDACDEDDDGDGVPDESDDCPLVSDPAQEDTDEDGLGDACDEDDDDDTVPDVDDNCPLVWNPEQGDLDQNDVGDACDDDQDGDGVVDGADNCPVAFNPAQGDADGDGQGDVCDADDDGDGDPDGTDCAPLDPAVHHGATELCDGRDEDCSGAPDDPFPTLGAPCDGPDSDQCPHGVVVCTADGAGSTCGPEAPSDIAETCDGADNDCDGAIDEGFSGLGDACDGPDSDQCPNGVVVCTADGAGSTCGPEAPSDIAETCDGVDNDCDGATDEGFSGLGDACDGPDSDQCPNGVVVCAADGAGPTCGPEAPSDIAETCDGVDNDCDGAVDEDFPELGEPCDGPDSDECPNGLVTCSADTLGVACGAETAADLAEDCATPADDDCDGVTNEGCAPSSVEITPFSVVLPQGEGGAFPAEGGAGEASSLGPAKGSTWSVDFGFYPTLGQ